MHLLCEMYTYTIYRYKLLCIYYMHVTYVYIFLSGCTITIIVNTTGVIVSDCCNIFGTRVRLTQTKQNTTEDFSCKRFQFPGNALKR